MTFDCFLLTGEEPLGGYTVNKPLLLLSLSLLLLLLLSVLLLISPSRCVAMRQLLLSKSVITLITPH